MKTFSIKTSVGALGIGRQRIARLINVQSVNTLIEIAQGGRRVGSESLCRPISIEQHAHWIEDGHPDPWLALEGQTPLEAERRNEIPVGAP